MEAIVKPLLLPFLRAHNRGWREEEIREFCTFATRLTHQTGPSLPTGNPRRLAGAAADWTEQTVATFKNSPQGSPSSKAATLGHLTELFHVVRQNALVFDQLSLSRGGPSKKHGPDKTYRAARKAYRKALEKLERKCRVLRNEAGAELSARRRLTAIQSASRDAELVLKELAEELTDSLVGTKKFPPDRCKEMRRVVHQWEREKFRLGISRPLMSASITGWLDPKRFASDTLTPLLLHATASLVAEAPESPVFKTCLYCEGLFIGVSRNATAVYCEDGCKARAQAARLGLAARSEYAKNRRKTGVDRGKLSNY